MSEDRLERGRKILHDIHAENGHKALEHMAQTSPDFARYVQEFAYGDIYARPGLDLRARQIATLSALITLGYAEKELYAHIQAGLKHGLSKNEILEIIIQMSVYAGFPAAVNALHAAEKVFKENESNDQDHAKK